MGKPRLGKGCVCVSSPKSSNRQTLTRCPSPTRAVLGLLTSPLPCLLILSGCHCHLCCCHHQARKTCRAGPTAASIGQTRSLGLLWLPRASPTPHPPAHGCGVTYKHTHVCLERGHCTQPLPQAREGMCHHEYDGNTQDTQAKRHTEIHTYIETHSGTQERHILTQRHTQRQRYMY